MGTAGLHRAVCHSQLPSLSRQPPPIGLIDVVMCDRRGGVCGGRGRGTGRHACGQVPGASPSSARSSLPQCHPPPHGSDSRGPEHGWAGGRPGAWRRSLVTGVRLRTKTTLMQFYEQFHAVTKYVNTVICNNIAVTYVKFLEISQ